MLEALRTRVLQDFPAANFAVPMSWPTQMRLSRGLWGTFPMERGSIDLSRLCEALPRGFRRAAGIFARSDVDVVLDASGFGYGDYWGLRKLKRRLVRLATDWKRQGRTLILLPQALGSFEKPGMASAFKTVINAADLIYVRDAVSLRHVSALGHSRNVRYAPDFTNLLKPELPQHLLHLRGRAFIIPNEKVCGTDLERRKVYVSFLRQAVGTLRAAGHNVALLIHEGKGDAALALELNAGLDSAVELIDEACPLVTKALIAEAKLTVSSRFHGLVSALSASVPSIACGWTHKYAELMSDYGCSELNVDLNDSSTFARQFERLIAAACDPDFRARLTAAADLQRSRSSAMWDEIVALLKDRYADQPRVQSVV